MFGIQTEEVNGQDIREVYLTAVKLVQRARQEKKPAFMLCHTYRYFGHHVGDVNREYYRSKEEEEDWKTNRDPLKTLSQWLIAENYADEKIIIQIEKEIDEEADTAVAFAKEAEYPDESEVTLHVFA